MPKRTQILNNELSKKDQKWVRKAMPRFWDERRQEEMYNQEREFEMVLNGEIPKVKHYDPVLENYRRQEWHRRIFGVWIFINGKPVYLTGDHYMFLQWSKMDHAENDGYANFFDPQLDRFYFRQYCKEDPWCHGYLFVGPRGGGKTAEEVACQLANMTMPGHLRHAAIQSKDADEAKEIIFQQKMVTMFNEYPDFFQPRYSHGSDPKDKMVFKQKSTTKKDAHKVKRGPELELGNTIRPFPPYNKALDSSTMSDIICDEIGKLKPETNQDAYTRHSSNLKAIFRFQVKRGLIRCTTTIEEMDKGGDECHHIWLESNPQKRDGNGYTVSKMYKFFISAIDTQTDLADAFGLIDRKAALTKIMNERAPIQDDGYKLALAMRKNPLNEDEAFIKEPGASPYDLLILTKRITELKNIMPGQRPGKQMSIEWVNGIVDGEVELVPDINGPIRLFYEPDLMWTKDRKLINACTSYVEDGKTFWMPVNNDLFRSSCDPIKFVKTDDIRASKLGAHGMMKYIHDLDNGKPVEQWISHNIMWEYHARHTDPEIDYENIIKLMRYFGHSIMPEFNTGEFVKHLFSRGYQKFLIVRKQFSPDVLISKWSKNSLGGDQPVHSSTEVIESYIKRTAAFIRRHGHRINSLPLLEQLRDFEPKHPTKYDLAVSFSYGILSLEADLDDEYGQYTQKIADVVSSWVPQYDISGNQSKRIHQPGDNTSGDENSYSDFDDPDWLRKFMQG
jgi:hypothetical protein